MNNKIKIGNVFILILLILLFSGQVDALGVTPGRTTVDFEPGLKSTISFTVLNNEHKDFDALIFVEGELAEYVVLHQALVSFTSTEDSKSLSYDVSLPGSLEKPGDLSAEVIIKELPPGYKGQGSFIGVTQAVISQLRVRVPYPGKYLDLSFQVDEAGVNDTIKFVVDATNYGDQDVNQASGTITILGPTNEEIARLSMDSKPILARTRETFYGSWNANINPGLYHAIAQINYDGKIARSEKNFGVGNLLIDLKDVNVKNFRLGGVAKFNILVENRWNQEIDVYADMTISNQDETKKDSFKSSTVKIKPLSEGNLEAFWDTDGFEEGVYNARISLNYNDRVTEKQFRAVVTLDSIEVDLIGATAQAIALRKGALNRDTLLMFLLIVLIGVNVAWFVYFKKRIKRK